MTATLATKVTLPTTVVRDVVSRAAKGSTMVDLAPLTELMIISVKDNVFSVQTTDNTNFLTATADVNAEDFRVVVETKKFTQTISKTTSVNITFNIDGKKLTVEGNGKHNFPIKYDVDDKEITFNEPAVEPLGATTHVTVDEFKSVTSLNKSCKGEKNEIPLVTQYYYAGESGTLTTNMYKACSNPVVLSDSPTLISSFVMDLATNVLDEEGLDIYQDDKYVVFSSTKGRLVASKIQDTLLSQFPAAALLSKTKEEFTSAVQINRTMLVQALDRICIFTEPDRQNFVTLTFNADGLTLYEPKTKSSEDQKYVSVIAPLQGTPVVNINALYLKNELMTCNKEDLVIRVDSAQGLQIVCGEVVLLLAALASFEELQSEVTE